MDRKERTMHKSASNPESNLDKFMKDLNASSKSLLKTEIPQKIVKLNRLVTGFDTSHILAELKILNESQVTVLKNEKSNLHSEELAKVVSSSEDLSSIDDHKVQIQFPNFSRLESHELIINLVKMVKPLMVEGLQDVRLILLWIQLKVPEIADGNNFGVSVQEEIIACLKSSESEILNDLDMFTDYFNQRGKLFTKFLKFAEIPDFGQGILEHDEAFLYRLRETMKTIKNHYLTMHNLCRKNLGKIISPRNEKSSIINSMY